MATSMMAGLAGPPTAGGGGAGLGQAASARRPSLPPMPDLSHLTAEERQIIESVMLRQREEEEKEQEMIK